MKYLIVGLGNIGQEYELTRHNIGFLVLDRLADIKKQTFSPGRYASTCMIKHKGRQIHLIKPATYMNLSGKAVSYWLQELKISRENMLVIVDDIALPFGKLRMRAKGSSAGHNGLQNIEDTLGGNDYPRLRFGIGSDFSKGQQADYVLSAFTKTEFNGILPLMDKSIDMALSFCSIGIGRTMDQYND
ncbi:MAG: aminoacyl-tRNA hydrolase [Cyclobacteriaceae bacterium]|nr:aminoacyl-tRNA hydrolase [Cyclobacteriaceae bacterium]